MNSIGSTRLTTLSFFFFQLVSQCAASHVLLMAEESRGLFACSMAIPIEFQEWAKRFKASDNWNKGGRRMPPQPRDEATNLEAYHMGFQKGKASGDFNDGWQAGLAKGEEKGEERGFLKGHAKGLAEGQGLHLRNIQFVVEAAVRGAVRAEFNASGFNASGKGAGVGTIAGVTNTIPRTLEPSSSTIPVVRVPVSNPLVLRCLNTELVGVNPYLDLVADGGP